MCFMPTIKSYYTQRHWKLYRQKKEYKVDNFNRFSWNLLYLKEKSFVLTFKVIDTKLKGNFILLIIDGVLETIVIWLSVKWNKALELIFSHPHCMGKLKMFQNQKDQSPMFYNFFVSQVSLNYLKCLYLWGGFYC